MGWQLEAGTHCESNQPVWRLTDGPGPYSSIYAEFSDRAAATACLKGYKAIGFVPRKDMPSDPVANIQEVRALIWKERK